MEKYFLGIATLALFLMGFQQKTAEKEPETKVELGEKLFFDPILSSKRTLSCASCHRPEFAFADTSQFSQGVNGIPTTRNTPSAMNLAGRLQLFWDGRAGTLEEQALQPIAAANEMNLPITEAVTRLNADPDYTKAFKKVFKSKPTERTLAEALAAYERTLETANTPYDRYLNGNETAMSPEAIRGRILFVGKANCANCHSGEDFTADRFKNIGLYDGKRFRDTGRFNITRDSTHIGHFKVPGLRNVALTAPYMHDGSFKTLREVINYYNRPDSLVKNGLNRDLSLSTPLGLTESEMADIEAFLYALTDDRFAKNGTSTYSKNQSKK
ncbi:cytochrome c peroxidase [Runella sp. MFBS21]|uniref:cytochrome-c peroxidase n=1 Tax=Runella sp. MFBS21 TaxID=3034018 RepID=UPI0023F8350F|nr:cytochrome c peroxidase [Runella sp. MFBS21]MDF7822202.1 cytochrome c peroxidase [Runella sp. MFBS21]